MPNGLKLGCREELDKTEMCIFFIILKCIVPTSVVYQAQHILHFFFNLQQEFSTLDLDKPNVLSNFDHVFK